MAYNKDPEKKQEASKKAYDNNPEKKRTQRKWLVYYTECIKEKLCRNSEKQKQDLNYYDEHSEHTYVTKFVKMCIVHTSNFSHSENHNLY